MSGPLILCSNAGIHLKFTNVILLFNDVHHGFLALIYNVLRYQVIYIIAKSVHQSGSVTHYILTAFISSPFGFHWLFSKQQTACNPSTEQGWSTSGVAPGETPLMGDWVWSRKKIRLEEKCKVSWWKLVETSEVLLRWLLLWFSPTELVRCEASLPNIWRKLWRLKWRRFLCEQELNMVQMALGEQKDTDCYTSLLALTLTNILKALFPWVNSFVSFRTVMWSHQARFFSPALYRWYHSFMCKI